MILDLTLRGSAKLVSWFAIPATRLAFKIPVFSAILLHDNKERISKTTGMLLDMKSQGKSASREQHFRYSQAFGR